MGWLRLGTGFRPARGLDGRALPDDPTDRRLRGAVHPLGDAVAAADAGHRSAARHRVLAHRHEQPGPCNNAWPAGHTGQTLGELTTPDVRLPQRPAGLRHPASSPWWAWPMDLKPVWFENATYAGDTGTMIYDGGNPALWWLAIFAMAFICWQAFKRRAWA